MGGSVPFEVSVEELARRRTAGEALAILDVREPWELEICSLPGSIAIPLATLPQRAATLPQKRPLIVLCHHGRRSAHAVQWLRAQGFANAINLEGGIAAWAERIDPATRTY
jgi:rhodanese-related sulfurtransferase